MAIDLGRLIETGEPERLTGPELPGLGMASESNGAASQDALSPEPINTMEKWFPGLIDDRLARHKQRQIIEQQERAANIKDFSDRIKAVTDITTNAAVLDEGRRAKYLKAVKPMLEETFPGASETVSILANSGVDLDEAFKRLGPNHRITEIAIEQAKRGDITGGLKTLSGAVQEEVEAIHRGNINQAQTRRSHLLKQLQTPDVKKQIRELDLFIKDEGKKRMRDGKRTVTDIIVPILDKANVQGIRALSDNEWDTLALAARQKGVDIALEGQVRTLLLQQPVVVPPETQAKFDADKSNLGLSVNAKLGKKTDKGWEVYDESGKMIGYWEEE